MFDVTPITSEKALDCGATCMQMLLAYYGEDVTLEELTEECNTRVVGCSGADLMRVGRAHGLDMKCYRMDAAEVMHQDRPAIIWWKFNHWCICCGIDAGKVVMINPDRGRFHLDKGTFASMYTGIALFNGEPASIPEPEDDDLAEAARILLGVSE